MKYQKQSKTLHILDANTEMRTVIHQIAETQDNAFFVCHADNIVQNYKLWKEKMPRIQPFFSVKCNDNLTVLEILAAFGAGFSCASKSEIGKILSLDVDAEKVLFANPAKMASHIRYSANIGVNVLAFDSEVELHKIKQYHPDAKLMICVRSDNETEENSMQFGCDPVTVAPNLLLTAKSLGLDVVGVSLYFETGTGDVKTFHRAVKAARNLFDFAATLGYNFATLHFGDGFPDGPGMSFDRISESINSVLEAFFPATTTITAEPSRFLVSSAFTLLCNVNFIRTTSSNDRKHHMYFVNDSVYGNFSNTLTGQRALKAKPLKEPSNAASFSSSIWGPICDDLDNLVEEISLPELQTGDWICFEDMGAHTLSMGGFNGFPAPQVYVAAGEEVWMLLKALVPLLEERLENESIPHDFDLGLETGQDWSLPSLPITIKLPRCGDGLVEEHVLDFVAACTTE